MAEAYKKISAVFSEYKITSEITAILSWDHAVMMPRNGHQFRVEQKEYLSRISHRLITNPENLENIEKAKSEDLDDVQKRNLMLMERECVQAAAVSEDLATRYSVNSVNCEFKWREARKEKNFKLIEKDFSELFDLSLEIAEIKSALFNMSAYDVQLDTYERTLSQKKIDEIFSEVKPDLKIMIERITDSQKNMKNFATSNISVEKQKEIGSLIMQKMGFDFDYGRLDVSTHPFCGGYSGDIRITTRYDEKNIIAGLMGIIHETGHALYEQNLPKNWRKMPIGSSLGMIVHESQSLFWERNIGGSKAFSKYLSDVFFDHLGKLDICHEDEIYKQINRVIPSFIRVEADEVTYPMHVIARYEIEKELFTKKIKIKDIPDIWNAKIKDLLGIEPSNDSEGCLQDIHWYSGFFGYFPCYSLGAMTAAQIHASLAKDLKEMDKMILAGDFVEIRKLLTQKFHSEGSYYNYNELLKKTTGDELNPKYFMNYLSHKYNILR